MLSLLLLRLFLTVTCLHIFTSSCLPFLTTHSSLLPRPIPFLLYSLSFFSLCSYPFVSSFLFLHTNLPPFLLTCPPHLPLPFPSYLSFSSSSSTSFLSLPTYLTLFLLVAPPPLRPVPFVSSQHKKDSFRDSCFSLCLGSVAFVIDGSCLPP